MNSGQTNGKELNKHLSVRRISHSLTAKLVLLFLLIIIPLSVSFVVYSGYARNTIFNEMAQSNKNMMELYTREMDETLSTYEGFLINTMASNSHILMLTNIDSAKDPRYAYEKIQIANLFQERLLSFSKLYAMFCYTEKPDDLVFQTYTGNADGLKAETLLEYCRQNSLEDKRRDWNLIFIEDEYYLFRIFSQRGIYIGACIRIRDLIEPLDLINLGSDGFAFMVSGELEPLTDESLLAKHSIAIKQPAKELYYLSGSPGKFLIMGNHFGSGNFYLYIAIPESTVLANLPILRIVGLMIIVFSVLVIALFFFTVRRLVFSPLKRINKTMGNFVDNGMKARLVPEKTSTEFETISNTFNSMLEQIEKLKVQMYEDELSRQRAELKHLQLQVNPHFFMNSLNVIFQLAQARRFELIQDMSNCLAQYFRFMYKSNSDFIRLADEIKHTDNYLKIQQMRFPNNLECHIDCPESLGNVAVPPLVVQSMVENSIKYALSVEHMTVISVHVQLISLNSDNYIRITVLDNGGGFPKEVLDEFEKASKNTPVLTEGTGIKNAKKRIALLYGSEAQIWLYNLDTKGAGVTIILPMREMS